MEQSVFSRGDITVIGIRGPFPEWAGLCCPVYHRKAELEQHPPITECYAFGDEITSPYDERRSGDDIRLFAEQGKVSLFPFAVKADAPVSIVYFAAKTEKVLSKILPTWWREGRAPIQRKREPLFVYMVEPEKAVWWMKDVAILIWKVLDEALRATTVSPQTAADASQLGWMCWEMLTWGIRPTTIRGYRRETMVRIAAAKALQPRRTSVSGTFSMRMTRSIGCTPDEMEDLVTRYFQTGMVPLV